MANTYPPSEAQRVEPTLLNAPVAPPPVKRTAREIAEERWFGAKRKAAPIAEGRRVINTRHASATKIFRKV